MTIVDGRALAALTVGQVAERFSITVRTLHHHDQIGLLVPSARTSAGYRLYIAEDITRLQHAVVYRRLGFALDEIAALLVGHEVADSGAVIGHLRRQRAAVLSRLDEMPDLVKAIDQALEKEMSGIKLTKAEQKELFGDRFSDDYAGEAEQRWGGTAAWKQSQKRTSKHTSQDCAEVKAAMVDATNAAFVSAMDDGEPPASERAMDVAEQHRLHIQKWFYDISPEFHRSLGDIYIADARFTKNYEHIRPGMAQYVHDAIHANADRATRATGKRS